MAPHQSSPQNPSGVHTNKSFVLNLLSHPEFVGGQVDTGFIARNPGLLQPVRSSNRCVYQSNNTNHKRRRG